MKQRHIHIILLVFCCLSQNCKQKEAPLTHENYYADSSIDRLYLRAVDLRDTDPDSALFMMEAAHSASKQANYYNGLVNALLGKGMILLNKGIYAESMAAFQEAYAYSNTHLKSARGKVNNNIALWHLYQNNYDSAGAYFQRSLHDFREYDPEKKDELLLLYNNLANVYVVMNQNTDALRYLDAAETSFASLKPNARNKINIGYAYVTKGGIYMDYEMLDKAEDYYKLALNTAGHYHLETKIVATNRLGEVYLQRKKPEIAISYFTSVLKDSALQKDVNPYYSYIEPSHLLAEAYTQLGDHEKAKQILLNAISFAKAGGFTTQLQNAHRQLSGVYRSLNQPWKALEEQATYITLKDSFLAQEKQASINQMEIKYRTAEKDKELAEKKLLIASQQTSIREQRTWIWGAAIAAVFTLALAVALYVNTKHRQKLQQQRINTLEKEQEIIELKAMAKGEEKERARMASELHDSIAGQLAAIKMNFSAMQHQYGLDYIPEYDEALKQLGDASEDVRRTAHNLMPAVLLQGGLYAAIQHFCKKIGSNLHISFQYYGDLPKLDPEFELSVYRIVQELVQNAVKHARANNILVQINTSDDVLNITVEDDGVGIDHEADYKNKGTGIKNINSRIKAFNGVLQIDSQPSKGTTVYVEFETGALRFAEA